MVLSKVWRTTNRPNGPTGYMRQGTFRDTSITFLDADTIDRFDYACTILNLKRSELLDHIGNGNTLYTAITRTKDDIDQILLKIQADKNTMGPKTLERS